MRGYPFLLLIYFRLLLRHICLQQAPQGTPKGNVPWVRVNSFAVMTIAVIIIIIIIATNI